MKSDEVSPSCFDCFKQMATYSMCCAGEKLVIPTIIFLINRRDKKLIRDQVPITIISASVLYIEVMSLV